MFALKTQGLHYIFPEILRVMQFERPPPHVLLGQLLLVELRLVELRLVELRLFELRLFELGP